MTRDDTENAATPVRLTTSMSRARASVIFVGCAIFAVVVSYLPVLTSSPMLNYDDTNLLGALKSVTSLPAFLEHFAKRQAVDVQPVRDFFYVLQLAAEKVTGLMWFHVVSVVIYLAIGLIFWLSLRKLGTSDVTCALAVLIFLTHPIHVEVVAWISGQKFLWSMLFCALATYYLLKIFDDGEKKNPACCQPYFLGSQDLANLSSCCGHLASSLRFIVDCGIPRFAGI